MIRVNGKTYSGRNVSIINNRVIIDGRDVTDKEDTSKEINITVEGGLSALDVDVCNKISITGRVGIIKTTSGDLEITGNVDGNISTVSGDIEVDGSVFGKITTVSGDIKHKTPKS